MISGIADNTIVIYSTDNGAESFSAGRTAASRRSMERRGTTFEGGFRVPQMIRWPGVIEPGTIVNDIISHEDWLPTLLAAAGDPDIVEKVKNGHTANGKEFRVHLDGYNFMPFFQGEVEKGPREAIYYFGQGGELNAVRWNDWKISFAMIEGNIAVGRARHDELAADYTPARRPVRGDVARGRDGVPALVRRQHVALRSCTGKARGVFPDYPRLSLPGGIELERGRHQLQLAQSHEGDGNVGRAEGGLPGQPVRLG